MKMQNFVITIKERRRIELEKIVATLRNTPTEKIDLIYDGDKHSTGYGYQIRHISLDLNHHTPVLRPHEFVALMRVGLEALEIETGMINSVLTRANIVR